MGYPQIGNIELQRRHFMCLADILSRMNEESFTSRKKFIAEFTYYLSHTNGQFDSDKFIKACK